MKLPLTCLCFAAIALFAAPAESATHTVRSTRDSGAGSLRQILFRARAGDTIVLRFRGTLELRSELVLNKNLTLRGVPAGRSRISGGDVTRILRVTEGVAATLEGLLFEEGLVEGDEEEVGAAILNEGTLTAQNCTLSDNYSYYAGGAIFNRGELVLERCQVFRNSSELGGGVYNLGSLQITYSNLSGNRASSVGGALYSLGDLNLDTCLVSENYADGAGGIATGGVAVITASAVVRNGTTSPVGAIANWGELLVSNSTVSGNRSDAIGGIGNSGQLTLRNSTISDNYGTNSIGGIESNGTLTMGNTIVAGNRIQPGGDEESIFDIQGEITSLGHNLIGDSTGASGLVESDLRDLTARLGPLQDNGGPTPTQAPLAWSPVIDGGDNALVDSSLTTDQRGNGFSRVVEGNGYGNSTVDIGAVEYQGVDLALTKKATGRAALGTRVTYTLTVRNLGLETAEGVVITDELTGGARFLSASTTQGTLVTPPVGVSGSIKANVGALAPGDSARVQITVRVVARPPLSNTAYVEMASFDVNVENDVDTVVLRR